MPESARRRMQTWSAAEHPDADLLTGFAEHTLTSAEREKVVSHLATCAPCREIVMLAMPEVSDAEVTAPAPRAWFRWPMLRWSAVAATVVVVGAAVSVLVPRRAIQPATVAQREANVSEQPKANAADAIRSEARKEAPAKSMAKAQRDQRDRLPKSKNEVAEHRAAGAAAAAPVATMADSATVANAPAAPQPTPSKQKTLSADAAKGGVVGGLGKDDELVVIRKSVAGGEIAGRVTDPSGAVVANALVKITNTTTNNSESARTDASGEYRFAAVTPGVYSIEATAPGMEAAKKNNLDVNGTVAQSITLRPGAATETVTVAAAQQPATGAMHGNAAANVPPPPPPPGSPQGGPMPSMRQGIVAGQAESASRAPLMKTLAATAYRWRVGSKGQIERSGDGTTWDKVDIDPGVTFRAVSSNSGELWAGGTGGALFHSTDAGRTWSRVKVGAEGMWVSDTITSVDFPTAHTGYVSTASGATWYTQDDGRTWQRRQ